MLRSRCGLPTIVMAVAFFLPFSSRADSDGVITGTGRVAIKRQPQILRAQFSIAGEAKDLAGAIAKLKEAQEAARKKLVELGAVEKSIEVGPTQMGAPISAREQYAKYMQDMQGNMGRPGVKSPAKPTTVTVNSTLKAEWALTGANADEAFIAGSTLADKIKVANIGKRDLKKLTPEEAEAAEEAAGLRPPGADDPRFQYLSRISDADRAAALAEAFQKARHDAAELAAATGSELGALRHVDKVLISPTAVEDADQTFRRTMSQQMGTAAPTDADVPTDEAIAPAPTPVELQITVTALFAVK